MKQATTFSLFALLLAGRALAGSGLDGCPPLKTTLSATDIDQATFLVSLESDGDIISWELDDWIEPEVTNAGSRCARWQEARVHVSAEGPTFVEEIELVVRNGYWSLKDEDIVARQLRQAATSETNETLREKIWQEWRHYRKVMAAGSARVKSSKGPAICGVK